MFAVIKTGGKQYRVSEGDILKTELLDFEIGEKFEFKEIFMIGKDKDIKVGSPTLEKSIVKAEVLDHIRDKKIIVFKKKRRKNYRRKNGHRQNLSVVKINKIEV